MSRCTPFNYQCLLFHHPRAQCEVALCHFAQWFTQEGSFEHLRHVL